MAGRRIVIMGPMIRLIAIECSSATASVALLHGGQMIDHRFDAGALQSERILHAIDELLKESGTDPKSIDAVAVSVGPGAFTGVRLAIAAAQGLALAWDVPVIPVSSLAVLAMSVDMALAEQRPVLSVLDARMGEVYAGWFLVTPRSAVAMGTEIVLLPQHLARPEGVARYVVTGSGFPAHEMQIIRAIGVPDISFGASVPQAADLARLARSSWPESAIAASRVEATYLRNKVALTSLERAAVASAAGDS